MDVKSILNGMIGGFFTVALASLILSRNSRTVEVIKAGFDGFSKTLAVAKNESGSTSTGI